MNDYTIKEMALKAIKSCRDEQYYDDVSEAILSVLWNAAIEKAYQAVSNLSAADIVSVVRCKDCKHYDCNACAHIDHEYENHELDYFCADGERRK